MSIYVYLGYGACVYMVLRSESNVLGMDSRSDTCARKIIFQKIQYLVN